MKRLILFATLTLSACKAIEGITRDKNVYYHSDCHPDIWTTQIPEKATEGCKWTLVESQ